LEVVRERLRAAVGARIAAGHNPDDPASGVYISPDSAWEDALGADLSRYAERLAQASRLLDLDALSSRILVLCSAAELDGRFARVFAFLQDDVTRRLPTPRLVVSLLSGPGVDALEVLACLGSNAPLRRRGCIRLVADDDEAAPLADQPIRVGGALTSFLLDASLEDPALDRRLHRHSVPSYPVGRREVVERIRAATRPPAGPPVLLAGADSADVLAVALGHELIAVDARAADDPELLPRAELIGALERRIVVFDHAESLTDDDCSTLQALAGRRAERLLICATEAAALGRLTDLGAVSIEVPMPSLDERRAAWSEFAGGEAAEAVAAKFRLSTGQIARAVEIVRFEAASNRDDSAARSELEQAARQVSSRVLQARAKRLATRFTWDDLVLADRQIDSLRAISTYLRLRDQVLTDWGYERTAGGRDGLKVLFAGESGTGKTMAASVLANDLGLELFAIDLATVVSKWVGETEQNLERIFAAAEGSNAILFFDEADALFGRRSEVSDSHDRYANIEVAYLLQRMETYPGAAILATNLKQNLDQAFLRRLDFVIDFPLPEVDARRRIWRLAIPRQAPVADDVDVDFLAERFKLSGGSIRNCSLAGAFEAAATGRPIGMAHLIRAVAAEYGKLGRLAIEADFERFHGMLADPDAPAEEPAPPADESVLDEAPVASSPAVRIRARIEEL
jgi:AAA+ superfamily predicted ATPase